MISGETDIPEGGTLNLTCEVLNSDPNLQWLSPDNKVLSSNGELIIGNITTNMSGEYTCVTTNPSSDTTNSSTIVTVQCEPKFKKKLTTTVGISKHFFRSVYNNLLCIYTDAPMVISREVSPLNISEGDTLELTCVYVGLPSPATVSWSRNGTQLNDSDSRITIETNSTSTTLTITGVRASEGGQYTCSAVNDVGTGNDTTSVRVQGNYVHTLAPPAPS